MMKINKENPAYVEYYYKWHSLAYELKEKLSEAEEQDRKNNFRGRDGKLSEITKKYSLLFNKLKMEYSFLYEEEEEEEE